MQAAFLPDRGVVKVSGEDARPFLHNIVTANVETLAPGHARFAALLTPQGKIVVDFFVIEATADDGGGFFLDCPRALAGDLVKKLKFYRLRAKVEIADLSGTLGVMAVWTDHGAGGAASEYGLAFADPRLPALGGRILLPPQAAADAARELAATLGDSDAYDRHRIALGVPQGGADFVYGDTFPHEADMDQLNGVDFAKGCYIGQEIVSRMEHRGTARNRVVPVRFDNPPIAGLPVTAGDKTIGTAGSGMGQRGLAMLRLDRVSDAMASGTPIVSGGVTLTPVKPEWARFAFPGETKEHS